MIQRAVNTSGLIVSPATAGQYLGYKQTMYEAGLNFSHTVCLGFFEMGCFIARTWPGQLRPFEYLSCFQIDTWSLLFTAILVLSIISSVRLKNYSIFYEYAWNYFNLLFQKSFQKFIWKTNKNYLLYIWVLSSLFLSIYFCADLLDKMVRAQPTIKIDSLEHLAKIKLKIIARADGALAEFAELKETELAHQIQPLLELYDFYDSKEERIKGLRAGTHVYVNQRLVLLFDAITISQMDLELNPSLGLNLMDILHISEDDGGLEPYFLFANTVTDEIILSKLKYM
jgi:hypothetical protein